VPDSWRWWRWRRRRRRRWQQRQGWKGWKERYWQWRGGRRGRGRATREEAVVESKAVAVHTHGYEVMAARRALVDGEWRAAVRIQVDAVVVTATERKRRRRIHGWQRRQRRWQRRQRGRYRWQLDGHGASGGAQRVEELPLGLRARDAPVDWHALEGVACVVVVRPRGARGEATAREEEAPARLDGNRLAEGALRVPIGLAAVEVKVAVGALRALLVWRVEGPLCPAPRHPAVPGAEAVVLSDDNRHRAVAMLLPDGVDEGCERSSLPLPQIVCVQVDKVEVAELVVARHGAADEGRGEEELAPARTGASADAIEEGAVRRPEECAQVPHERLVFVPVALVAHVQHKVGKPLRE